MTRPFCLSLTVHLATPLSSGAAGVGEIVADKTVVRNGLGEYILPGSQVRGTLRHACERVLRALAESPDALCQGPRPERMCPQPTQTAIPEIPDPFDPEQRVRCCPMCAVFGSPYFHSPLQFHDLVCSNPFKRENEQPYTRPRDARLGHETLRPMVSLNRRRRVAEAQRLFFVETTPVQSGFTFTNAQAVTGQLKTQAQVKLLLAGLKSIVALGGGRSRGLGWGEIQASAQLGEEDVVPGDWKELQTLWHTSE